MREFIISASLIGSLLIYALVINVSEMLIMFTLFGIVPGSEKVLTPLQMQQVWLTIAILAVVSFAAPRLRNYRLSSRKTV